MQKTEVEIQKFRTQSGLLLFLLSFLSFFLIMNQCEEKSDFEQRSSQENEELDYSFRCGNMTIRSFESEKGHQVFNANCAACHFMNKDMTGPSLNDVLLIYNPIILRGFISNEDSIRNTENFVDYLDRNEEFPPYNHRHQITDEDFSYLLEYLK